MKRICDLQLGDKVLYFCKWYQVTAIGRLHIHISPIHKYGNKKHKLPVNSKEYLGWEGAV